MSVLGLSCAACIAPPPPFADDDADPVPTACPDGFVGELGAFAGWEVPLEGRELVDGGSLELRLLAAPRGQSVFVAIETILGEPAYALALEDGRVRFHDRAEDRDDALRYVADDWNEVVARYDRTSQSYEVEVNGARSAPATYRGNDVRTFRLRAPHDGDPSKVGFIDDVSVRVRRGTDVQTLLHVDFAVPPADGPRQATVPDDVLPARCR